MRVTEQVKALADRIGRHPATVWRWIKQGCDIDSEDSIQQFSTGKKHRQNPNPNPVQKSFGGSGANPQETQQIPETPEPDSTPDLNLIELGPVGKRGAAAALARLEGIEERAFARLERAIEHGNPFEIKGCGEFYLRACETLRQLDLSIETERRNAVELVPKKQVEAVALYVAEWLRIAFAQFLSSESRSLMGIKDPADFRLYATDRFRGIVFAAVKTSRKTNSPIPTWAAAQVTQVWDVMSTA